MIFFIFLGPFKIVIKNLDVTGSAKLAVETDGKLRAQEIVSDMKVTNMSVNFENLGILKNLFSSFVNSGDDSVNIINRTTKNSLNN